MTGPVAYWHVSDIEAKLAEVTAAGAHCQGVSPRRRWWPVGGRVHRPGRQRPRVDSGSVKAGSLDDSMHGVTVAVAWTADRLP